jgi:hypothetical protein
MSQAIIMRKLLFLFVLSFFLCSFFSCVSKKLNPLVYKKTSIVVGHGGGMTGLETSYVILDNGNVYILSKMGQEYKYIGRLKRNKVKQIFENYKLLNFELLELDAPGNTYQFMDFHKDGKNNRITWTHKKGDENLNLLHKILLHHIKSL